MRHTVRARLTASPAQRLEAYEGVELPGEEMVAVVGRHGSVVGVEPRWRVRRDNLRHQATGVVVRDRLGRVYVHRRTQTKDVYPGMYDCCAGGVVTAGETPEQAARRELAEELGIRGVPLTLVLRGDYADDVTSYEAYVYETVWDGPVRHEPSEVEWGGWKWPSGCGPKPGYCPGWRPGCP